MYKCVLQFLAGALQVLEKSSVRQALHAFWNPEEIQSFNQSCLEVEERVEKEMHNFERTLTREDRVLNIEAHLHTAQQLGKVHRQLTEIRILRSQMEAVWNRQTAEERSQVLRWVSGSPPLDHHRNAAKGRTPDTGEWLSNHQSFQHWENSLSPMILWLHEIRE